MLRYYITNGLELGGTEPLLACIRRNLAAGVDMIQIREKDVPVRDVMRIVRAALSMPNPHGTKILVNARADIALACGAQGLHLTSGGPSPLVFRGIAPPGFLIGVSCHHVDEVCRAEQEGADFVVFGPVFHTPSKTTYGDPVGLNRLKDACSAVRMPVLALGGVSERKIAGCIEAGAAGIAGITMFQS